MNKKNIILASILGLLLVFAYLYQGPIKTMKYSKSKSKNIFEKISVNAIDSIEIINNSKTVKLSKEEKEDNGEKKISWKIDGTKAFYAKENFDNEIINKIKELQKANFEIVSENKDKKGDFLTDSNGTEVKFLSGENTLIDFIVGDISGFTKSYLSQKDISETYLVDLNVNSLFVKNNWYDLSVLNLDKNNINKIRFQYPDSEFTIEKNDDLWKGVLPYEFDVDEDVISGILDSVSKLNAVNIPVQTFDGTGLEKHSIIVQISGNDLDQTIMVGNKNEDGNYFAKRGDSDNIYLIKESDKEALDKRISDFK